MFSSAKSAVHKVPANDTEALKTPLMGLFEKKRARNLYIYLDKLNLEDPKTWGDLDLNKVPMSAVFKKFSLDAQTIDFMGHAVALQTEDSYLNQPAMATI